MEYHFFQNVANNVVLDYTNRINIPENRNM
jgi:hypothetical protein